ncbi:cation channel sperm-associated protein subunit gamma isoform X8 [Neophocaena asiaeorientalis asiaeorientalis]|uniref:Cation channel sperm-associated protein subunit gamma isoform X8 n=1 Tax=Neophocaena asiaeorientalis asiaeorientalis TaxID=1706337 RepID=A0A341AFP7_NEOAA|nr:cation channel sperm-associated protein subunit gamma isoform X8 [Neophocaena asiaeorientalis asiaeorientalis]
MSPAGPAWPRLRVLQALWALLVVLLAPWRLWAIKNTQECTWQVVLNNFETVGKKDASDRFVDQEPLYTVDKVFSLLVDAPIDPDEVRGLVSGKRERSWTCTPLGSGHLPTLSLQTYLGFPYYLKINYSCKGELFNLIPRYFVNVPSRPLWYTVDQAPVFILGGIPEEKAILLTDTNFKDFFLVELSIDSCWVGSFYCPPTSFTATIYDAIATESTLFIRQNQLIYYFTGTYTTLHESNRGSERWVRVLANECIKKLCPVHFHSNGSEYVMALTTGKHEGYVHFGTITDGRVSFELLPRQRSVCNGILVVNCSITWAVFIAGDYNLLLLVEIEDPSTRKYFQVVSYDLVSDYLVVLYTIPEFIPDARGLEFLMVLGTESYTNFPMVPKGMSYNPYNNLLFIWGNFLLQSYNSENFIYLADFPKELSIKYLVNSFYGDTAIVTETEEIWYLLEGSYQVYKLFPSKGWEVHVSLQVMQQSSLYAPNETMVTLFYEDHRLYQLVYLIDNQQGRLVKRLVPVEQLLMYQQISTDYLLERQGSHLTLSFTNFCPFTVMRLRDLPNPQIYTRQERYRAQPPRVLEPGGFHSDNSLAVYQGLVYYLLWLHSKYDKPYADPVHDPTWRWWKNKKQDQVRGEGGESVGGPSPDPPSPSPCPGTVFAPHPVPQDYYFYLASNWRSAGSVHVDMASYEKIYDLKAENELPERIFLDKGTSYRFSVFLTAGEPEPLRTVQGKVGLAVVLADPECIEAVVKEKVLVNRNSVLFWVTLSDKRFCFDQGISGHHLMKTSMLLKVVGSSGHCFQNTHQGPRMQGNLMVPVLIGCPPGKRLAFDITYTLEYNRLQNKHYFDCVHVDPEMPCFLFRDIFYPFFLIQDLVTGDSGSFQGSYVLKVVGGGPTLDTIKEYSEEDIYRFNSPLDKTGSLIWTTRNTTTTEDSAFNILSHNSLGIEWLCMENSPCHDTIPHSIFASEFFFKVLVSNRGVDKSTYCDYQLTFQLHIHGLPLSARRAFLILMVSASLIVGLVILYVISCLLSPYVVKVCNVLCWKINNIVAWESYIYSVASDTRAFSNTSGTKSGESSGGISRVVSMVAGENKTDTKETLRKKPIS